MHGNAELIMVKIQDQFCGRVTEHEQNVLCSYICTVLFSAMNRIAMHSTSATHVAAVIPYPDALSSSTCSSSSSFPELITGNRGW